MHASIRICFVSSYNLFSIYDYFVLSVVEFVQHKRVKNMQLYFKHEITFFVKV
jgi:hypothetical protein